MVTTCGRCSIRAVAQVVETLVEWVPRLHPIHSSGLLGWLGSAVFAGPFAMFAAVGVRFVGVGVDGLRKLLRFAGLFGRRLWNLRAFLGGISPVGPL